MHGDVTRWGIVLAGGEGTRIRPLIESWLGSARPKQYCTFFGDESMLEETLGRAMRLTEPERILTVIGPGHGTHVDALSHAPLPGRVLEQPRSLETAPGVFLPLAHVMAREPDSVVLIMPSDHFMHPEDAVVETLERATDAAARAGNRILLLAAEPEGPESDYGWIEPGDDALGDEAAPGLREVRGFREKPSAERAREFYRRGFLWNTMIVAARARTLWEMGQRTLPAMTAQFDLLRQVLRAVDGGRVPPRHAEIVLEHLYRNLEPVNFSRDLLEPAAAQILTLPLAGVQWSDWGRAERIRDSLARIGTAPHFSASGTGTREAERLAATG